MKVVKRYKGLTDRIENIENIDTLVAIQIDCFHIVSALESTNIAIYVSSRDSGVHLCRLAYIQICPFSHLYAKHLLTSVSLGLRLPIFVNSVSVHIRPFVSTCIHWCPIVSIFVNLTAYVILRHQLKCLK